MTVNNTIAVYDLRRTASASANVVSGEQSISLEDLEYLLQPTAITTATATATATAAATNTQSTVPYPLAPLRAGASEALLDAVQALEATLGVNSTHYCLCFCFCIATLLM